MWDLQNSKCTLLRDVIFMELLEPAFTSLFKCFGAI